MNKQIKRLVLLSAFSLIISLIALGFSLLFIQPFTITSDGYIGAITTLIAICVTIALASQLWNVVSLKDKFTILENEIKKWKIRNGELEKYISDIDLTLNETRAFSYQARQHFYGALLYYLIVLEADIYEGNNESIKNNLKEIEACIGDLPKSLDRDDSSRIEAVKARFKKISRYTLRKKYFIGYKDEIKHIFDKFCIYTEKETSL